MSRSGDKNTVQEKGELPPAYQAVKNEAMLVEKDGLHGGHVSGSTVTRTPTKGAPKKAPTTTNPHFEMHLPLGSCPKPEAVQCCRKGEFHCSTWTATCQVQLNGAQRKPNIIDTYWEWEADLHSWDYRHLVSPRALSGRHDQIEHEHQMRLRFYNDAAGGQPVATFCLEFWTKDADRCLPRLAPREVAAILAEETWFWDNDWDEEKFAYRPKRRDRIWPWFYSLFDDAKIKPMHCRGRFAEGEQPVRADGTKFAVGQGLRVDLDKLKKLNKKLEVLIQRGWREI
ncbi:hypothetical protein B0T25DRAFT_138056 [Lasiosphaeria hispida]|uniref:Uncharacterized protein n=1 Tax=Lasiosphaeria hispida TaxID=260671 RepID=A0AAJ0HKW0_9PEZI|nr:hypothetical protein B0T25DRAFT_138056 [Lasiosphaeria hispida]